MRVVVCGGRHYEDREKVFTTLDALHAKAPFTLLMEGGADGADRLAHTWATRNIVLCRTYFADWEKYGTAAGPKRNQRMLDVGMPDLVVAFPGGKGTADMVRRAKLAKVKVLQIAP